LQHESRRMSVESLIEDVIAREGGYVNDPDDPGGPTKYGITQNTLAAYLGRPVSVSEVAALTQRQAHAIYRSNYIDRPRVNLAPAPLQPFLLDSAVNHGPADAVRMLQRVLSDVGTLELAIDGVMGPQTAEAARVTLTRTGDRLLLSSLADERRRLYLRLTAERPALKKFLAGWIARADSFDPLYDDRSVRGAV